MPITSISLNDFRTAAATAAAPATCLRVDANGVRAVSSLRAFFTLGATHRNSIAAFVDALKAKYGDRIGDEVAARYGLAGGPGLDGRPVRRITGQIVNEAINYADRVDDLHQNLLETFLTGKSPEARGKPDEGSGQAWRHPLDAAAEPHVASGLPEGEAVGFAGQEAAQDLQGAFDQWATGSGLGDLSPEEKAALMEAVYRELAQQHKGEFNQVEALCRRVAAGDCHVLQQYGHARPALLRLADENLRAFVTGWFCHCDSIRNKEAVTQEEIRALLTDLEGAWQLLSPACLQASAAIMAQAQASAVDPDAFAADAPTLRGEIMARLTQSYAGRPAGQRWTTYSRLNAIRDAVLRENLQPPSPLEKACGQRPLSATNARWRENVRNLQGMLAQMQEDRAFAATAGGPDNARKLRAALLAAMAADPDCAERELGAAALSEVFMRRGMPILEAVQAEFAEAREAFAEAGLATTEAEAQLLAEGFREEEGVMRYVGLAATIARVQQNRAGLELAIAAQISDEGWAALARGGLVDAEDQAMRDWLRRALLERVMTPEYLANQPWENDDAPYLRQVSANLAIALAERQAAASGAVDAPVMATA